MSGGRRSRPSIWTTGFDGVEYSGPTVTCVLAAVLVLVFAAQWWGNAVAVDGSAYAVWLVGGLHAPSVREGEVFRIFTSPFLHMHGQHLIANLVMVLSLCGALEGRIGNIRTLLVVALSMFAASLAAVAFPPGGGVLAGASGGMYGVVGAWVVLVLRDRRSQSTALRWARRAMPIILIAVFLLPLVPFPSSDRIGWSAHLGGFVGGLAAMALLSRGAGPVPLGSSPRWMRRVAAGLMVLFLWAVAVDVQRVASGRICAMLDRDGLSEEDRAGLAGALRDLPVTCANLEPGPPPATPADGETPERPRTRSSANRRGP
jgi:membrane associated rhomboid family serine protease